MATFSTCRKCGCKAVVLPVIGALLHAAAHHQDFCRRERPDGADLFCMKFVAEPAHTHEREPLNQPMRWVRVTSSSSGTSTVLSMGTYK
jgi:hypothetical protein